MKTLIVFYSRTGRTAATARRLAHEMENTSRLEIVPMAYRGTAREYLHYLYCTLTRKEMEIDLYKVDFAKYDRIILIIPVISRKVRLFHKTLRHLSIYPVLALPPFHSSNPILLRREAF